MCYIGSQSHLCLNSSEWYAGSDNGINWVTFEQFWRDFFMSFSVSTYHNDSRELINPNLHFSTFCLIDFITKLPSVVRWAAKIIWYKRKSVVRWGSKNHLPLFLINCHCCCHYFVENCHFSLLAAYSVTFTMLLMWLIFLAYKICSLQNPLVDELQVAWKSSKWMLGCM